MGLDARRPLAVVVATPLGESGKGGVDRMMDVVRNAYRARPNSELDVCFIVTRGPGSILLSPFYLATALAGLATRRIAGKADVLHVNLGQQGSTLRKIVLCRFARLCQVPYVIHLHGAGYREYWDGAGPLLARAIRNMFVNAAAVAVLGNVWRDFVRSKIPTLAPIVLPNATSAPISVRRHENRAEPVHILFLGEIGPRKGVPELIAALERLKPLHWRATIAGDGQLASARAAAAAGGLEGRIDFPGWLAPADVEAMLADADVLVLPSHEENLPMSVIEGMAYGLAVVTTPVGAVTDIIDDGVTGLLAAPGDKDALAAALERTITDTELRGRIGAAARAFHDRYLSEAAYLVRLESLWKMAAGTPRPGGIEQEGQGGMREPA